MNRHGGRGAFESLRDGLLTLVLVAFATRVAWELLAPALPFLVVLLILVVIVARLLGLSRW